MLVSSRAVASPDGRQPDARDAVRYANALVGCEDDEDGSDDRDDDDAEDELDPCDATRAGLQDELETARPGRDTASRDSTDGELTQSGRDSRHDPSDDADDARWVGDVSLDELEAEAIAMIDDEVDEDAIRTGLAFTSSTFDDASAMRDLGERHHGPSRWGRVDLTVAWRRAWSVARNERSDALWLYATWRK